MTIADIKRVGSKYSFYSLVYSLPKLGSFLNTSVFFSLFC